jgi:hypothetical protein
VRIPQNTTSPSAHVAFEFNQSKTACGAASGGLVTRTAKDLLVVYDFEGGTDSPVIRIERWVTSGACEISSHSAPCWGPADVLGAGEAEAAVNTGVGGLSGALPNGDTIAPSAPQSLGLKEFGEAGIDLTDSGVFDANTCITFGKAYGVSRTSGNSGTAQMKDLVGPVDFSLSNCPKVNIVKTGGNAPLAGAKFELFQPAGVDGNGVPSGTSKYDCTTGTDGKCTMENVLPGSYTLDETVVPSGYTKASGLPQTVTVVSGTDQTLTFEDPPAPGSVDITKLDDAGDPVVGARFQLYSPQGIANGAPTGSAVTGKYCDTDVTGSCTISNVTPGDYTLDETVIPTGYAKDADLPENITVPNGGTVTKSYTDPRKFKVIVIVCRQTDDTLYPSDIKIDGDAAGKSLSSAQATAASLSESALCGISTGSKGNLRAAPDSSNPHDADIDIPNKQT